jgi:hypothetical protein
LVKYGEVVMDFLSPEYTQELFEAAQKEFESADTDFRVLRDEYERAAERLGRARTRLKAMQDLLSLNEIPVLEPEEIPPEARAPGIYSSRAVAGAKRQAGMMGVLPNVPGNPEPNPDGAV